MNANLVKIDFDISAVFIVVNLDKFNQNPEKLLYEKISIDAMFKDEKFEFGLARCSMFHVQCSNI